MKKRYKAKENLYMTDNPERLVFVKNKIYDDISYRQDSVSFVFIDEEGDRHSIGLYFLKQHFTVIIDIKFGR